MKNAWLHVALCANLILSLLTGSSALASQTHPSSPWPQHATMAADHSNFAAHSKLPPAHGQVNSQTTPHTPCHDKANQGFLADQGSSADSANQNALDTAPSSAQLSAKSSNQSHCAGLSCSCTPLGCAKLIGFLLPPLSSTQVQPTLALMPPSINPLLAPQAVYAAPFRPPKQA